MSKFLYAEGSGISDMIIHVHNSGRRLPYVVMDFPQCTQGREFINGFFTLMACAYFQICDPGADVYKQSSTLGEG